MKLLSHNHLLCLNKSCKCNDALNIEPKKVIQIESEPKLSFMIHILSMIDYNVLLKAADQIGITDLPQTLPPQQVMESSESFLRSMQKVLLDSNVEEGQLRCSKCKTSYTISNGVVDMMHPQKPQLSEQKNENENDENEETDNDNEENNDENNDVEMNNFLNEDDEDNDNEDNDDDIKNEDTQHQDMVEVD